MTKHIVKIIILISLFATLSFAQQEPVANETGNSADTVFVMHKSAWGAVLRSAVIPGWGQFYTQSYLKIPIIWGVGAWLVYLWIQNNKYYKDNLNKYDFYLQQYQTSQSVIDQSYASQYFTIKNFYQDQRDLVAIYMGLTYLLNLVDAYVDAQLFDFSVSPNISTKSLTLNMRVNF